MRAKTLDIPCANCGARLDLDGSTQSPVCTFCGTRNTLSHEVWQELHPAAPVAPKSAPADANAGTSPVTIAIVTAVTVVGLLIAIIAIAASGQSDPLSAASPAPLRSVAEPNSPCEGTKAACSTDGRSMLECDGTKMVVALTCKGPKGCRGINLGESVSCDYTRADENDPCNVKDHACSSDGKSELRCDGAKFVIISSCAGPDGCTIAPSKDAYTLTCDDHVAPVDSPCLEDGRFACSSDMRSMLRCTRGHFMTVSVCKSPCFLKKNLVDDTTAVTCN